MKEMQKRGSSALRICSFVSLILFSLSSAPAFALEAPIPIPPPPRMGAQLPAPTPAPGKSSKKSSKKKSEEAPKKTVHWGGDRSTLNRKTKMVELRGNAYLIRNNEDFRADEIDFNLDTQEVNARGRVRYKYGEFFVKADSIYLDIRNKTGTIINGNLTNGQFALRGAKMEQVGTNRFLIHDYDYTTCLDCPNSWEMTGASADITVEGYAYIKDFIFKIKDAPFFWLPYMIVPTKSKRQSGLIFPRFGFNDVYGVHYTQPYFWAINDWSDMTIGAAYYSNRGGRLEWEGRYALTRRSQGVANIFWTKDDAVPELKYRYAGKARLTQELPWGFEGKLRVNEVSDSGYPIIYSEDIPGRYEPVLSSDLFFSKNDPDVSTVVSFRRIRNLLFFNPNNVNQKDSGIQASAGYDPTTVQEFPRIVVTSNDQFVLGGKFAAGIEARFNRFSRSAGPFDNFSTPTAGTTSKQCDATNPNCTIREANRFTLVPNLYTTLNPWPWLSVVPSMQYRGYFYNFSGNYNNLARGYLLGQMDVSLQVEKMIPTSDPNVSYKHTIRPTLTYSIIPDQTVIESSKHPFVEQVASQARPGQYFDNSDIVPLGTSQNLESYFTPLGNSLTYGVVSQLFRKEKNAKGETQVSRRMEAQAMQTLDIREAKRALQNPNNDNRVILSPFFMSLLYEEKSFSASSQYTYYSFLDRYSEYSKLVSNASPHLFSANVTWILERAKHQGLLWYERSLGLSYSYSRLTSKVSSLRADLIFSVNDYIMPEISYTLDLISNPRQVLDSKYAVVFQSPSRCWRLDAGVTSSRDRGAGIIMDFALNLTGSTFGGDTKR